MDRKCRIVVKSSLEREKNSAIFSNDWFKTPDNALKFVYRKFFNRDIIVAPEKEFYLEDKFGKKIIDLPKTGNVWYFNFLSKDTKFKELRTKFNKIFSLYKMQRNGIILH